MIIFINMAKMNIPPEDMEFFKKLAAIDNSTFTNLITELSKMEAVADFDEYLNKLVKAFPRV